MADSLKHQLLLQAQKQLRTEVNSSAIRKNGSSEIFYEFWIFLRSKERPKRWKFSCNGSVYLLKWKQFTKVNLNKSYKEP